MKKISFALLAMIFILSCTQAQTQNDFYGKWIFQNEGKMEYSISGKTLTSVWTPALITYVTPVEENTFEIFSWEKIKNDKKDSMNDYPTGYLIGLRHGLGNTTLKLFMHRDKNSFISAYENKGVYYQELFIKPCSQSDFYKAWVMIDDEGKKYSHRVYTFTDKEFAVNSSSGKYSDKILSWENITNKDTDTKNDYPTGFLITTDINSYSLKTEYYLHKNKKSLLQVSDINNSRNKVFFVKN